MLAISSGTSMLLSLASLTFSFGIIVWVFRERLRRLANNPSLGTSPQASVIEKTKRFCPQCAKEMSADSPQGLCPSCLMRVGLGSQFGEPKQQTVPLAPEEIAKDFPQLEIIELLGQGGMGTVYKARQPQLDRFIALKILSPELSRDPAFAERFSREAKALARLNHPNIVGVYDFGKTGDFYYFIMEFVDGMNLWQMEQTTKHLSSKEALAIVPKICDALQYAHDEGIVHRDIKPANILIDKKGRVKIADFGLAKLLGKERNDFGLTETKATMGTPHYMAPEQIEHPLDVDHRADIYSLGVVFYEMLTGELPIGRFAAPSQKVQIDVRLDEVVLRALEKEPEHRYQQASEVKTRLETIANNSMAGGKSGSEPINSTPSPLTAAHPDRFWRRFVIVVGVIVLGVILIPVVAILLGIALPAFQRVRPHAQAVNQENNQQLQEKVIAVTDWQNVPGGWQINGRAKLQLDNRSVLKIENTNDAPLQVSILKITNPSITATNYALSGEIKYENVNGNGYLEMWSFFLPAKPGLSERQYFSQTFGENGADPLRKIPMRKISDTSSWRAFMLPFFSDGASGNPKRLELNIYLLGRGTVYLSSIKLTEWGGTRKSSLAASPVDNRAQIKSDSLSADPEDPKVKVLTEELQKARNDLDSLRVKYTETHPSVLEKKALTDPLEKQIVDSVKSPSRPSQPRGKVYIWGNGVPRPLYISLIPGESKTILEAVIDSVPNDSANLEKIQLIRINPETKKPEIRVIDVKAIQKQGAEDVVLMEGDRIEIPRQETKRLGKVYIYGAGLPKSEYISLPPGESKAVSAAVAEASVNEFANLKKVKLIRTNPETKKRETRVIDLKAIQNKEAEDVILMDGDTIEIPERTFVF